jgi:hypothetical protein
MNSCSFFYVTNVTGDLPFMAKKATDIHSLNFEIALRMDLSLSLRHVESWGWIG